MKKDFANEMKEWTTKVEIKNEKQCRAIALTLFSKIVKRTPVGNPSLWKSGKAPKGYVGGRARGNWWVNYGPGPEAKVTWRVENGQIKGGNILGKNDTEAQAHVMGQLNAFNLANRIWLSNGLPYISRLEYDSWSTQAPNGMVRVSLSEIGAIVKES